MAPDAEFHLDLFHGLRRLRIIKSNVDRIVWLPEDKGEREAVMQRCTEDAQTVAEASKGLMGSEWVVSLLNAASPQVSFEHDIYRWIPIADELGPYTCFKLVSFSEYGYNLKLADGIADAVLRCPHLRDSGTSSRH